MKTLKKLTAFAICLIMMFSTVPLTPALAATSVISNVEVNQVMSYGQSQETGDYYAMDTFVAGKDTSIFVELNKTVTIDPTGTTQYLIVAKNGKQIAKLSPRDSGRTNLLRFQPKKISDVKNWSAGEYTLKAVVNNNSKTVEATFQNSKKIKVLAVPIKANYDGKVVNVKGDWKTAIKFTQKTYPIANENIEYVLSKPLNLSSKKYDLTTDNGQYNVWMALTQLQTPENDYELILGFVRDRQGADGTTQGYTYGSPANIITESDGDMQATVAHEIAHCYDVGDEYPGGTFNLDINLAPYGMVGYDWNNSEIEVKAKKSFIESGNEYGLDSTGSVIVEEQRPNDAGGEGLLPTITSFMGSGSSEMGEYWITSAIWEQLYRAFIEKTASATTIVCENCYTEGTIADYKLYAYCENTDQYLYVKNGNATSFKCEECGETHRILHSTSLLGCKHCGKDMWDPRSDGKNSKSDGSKTNLINITGTLTKGGKFTADPWYVYQGDDSSITPAVNGTYAVTMYDKNQKVLEKSFITPSFLTTSNPPRKLEEVPVSITMAYPSKTASIVIAKEDKVIYTGKVSANAPTASITPVKTSAPLKGKVNVSWKATDIDKDKMTYQLWYTPNGSELINVANGISSKKCSVNFSELPGSDHAQFILYATDGINTTMCTSNTFKVGYKKPEVISDTTEILKLKNTEEFYQEFDIYDQQDGWLTEDTQVVWKDENGEEFGTGNALLIFPFELSVGKHTFTMTAFNSKNVSTSQKVTVQIIDDSKSLTQNWATSEVIEALSVGFVLPIYRLDDSITRIQFARLLATEYVIATGENAPDYQENIIKDVINEEEAYYAYICVKNGLLKAPRGKFNPDKTITQKEAMTALYKIAQKAHPKDKAYQGGEAAMKKQFLSLGILDRTGPNAYKANTKLTREVALVRCYRMILGL